MLADRRLLGYTHTVGVGTRPRPLFLCAEVAKVLGRIGPGAGTAAPALRAMLGDEQAVIRAAAAEALGGISPAAVPALIQALQDPEKEVRQAAVSALGEVGAEAAAAVPDLVALLPQDGPRGLHVVFPLSRIGPAAVPALIQALRGRDTDVRSRAAQVLGLIGPEAQAAAPTLVEVLRDPEARVRVRAAEALWQVAQDPTGVALLAAVLGDEDGVLRRDAARFLGQMGPAARPAVPALVEALRDADDATRVPVAEVLGRIGPGAAAAVPALAEALREPEDPISRTAAASPGADRPGGRACLARSPAGPGRRRAGTGRPGPRRDRPWGSSRRRRPDRGDAGPGGPRAGAGRRGAAGRSPRTQPASPSWPRCSATKSLPPGSAGSRPGAGTDRPGGPGRSPHPDRADRGRGLPPPFGSRRRAAEGRPRGGPGGGGLADVVERHEGQIADRLRLATERLEEAQQERIWAVVEAHQAGLSIRQIAAATGLSPSRVHQLLGSEDEESNDKDADAPAHPAPDGLGGAGAATRAIERVRGAGTARALLDRPP